MNLNEYERIVAQTMIDNPSWRYGQTLFNVLYAIDPERADEIRGTRLDPFYAENNDKKIIRFWEFLFDNFD